MSDPALLDVRCRAARVWISSAVDGEATRSELVAMRAHLAECTECRAWAALAESLALQVRTAEPAVTHDLFVPSSPETDIETADRRRRRIPLRALLATSGVAAALVAGIVVASGVDSRVARDDRRVGPGHHRGLERARRRRRRGLVPPARHRGRPRALGERRSRDGPAAADAPALPVLGPVACNGPRVPPRMRANGLDTPRTVSDGARHRLAFVALARPVQRGRLPRTPRSSCLAADSRPAGKIVEIKGVVLDAVFPEGTCRRSTTPSRSRCRPATTATTSAS